MRTRKSKVRKIKGNYPSRYWWVVLVVIPILVALIGGVAHYLRSPTSKEIIIIPQHTTEYNLDTTSSTLKLRMCKAGWFDLESGEIIYEFDLFNTGDQIAVVRCILLEVLEIKPEGPPPIEAILLDKAEYHIVLKHDRVGDCLITDKERKYVKGDIDKFVVGVKSDEPGWRYMLRIKIIWYDPEEEGERILYSDTDIARFYK